MTVAYDSEIFDEDPIVMRGVIWWLLGQLGGKVEVPTDEKFWLATYPEDASLVMYKEDGKIYLEAERLDNAEEYTDSCN